MGDAQGRLPENVANFVRLLRGAGMPVGPGHTLTAVSALQSIDLTRRGEFYWALHGVLVSRPEQRDLFESAFRLFWRDPFGVDEALAALLSTSRLPVNRPRPQVPPRLVSGEGSGADPDDRTAAPREEPIPLRMAFTSEEVLRTKDFDAMTAEEAAQARDAIRRLDLDLRPVVTRRTRRDVRGRWVDLRSTLRSSLRTGGDPLTLERRSPTSRPPSLVVLCDISGSMEAYARMLLHFCHALTNATNRVHTFVFGTRLTNITRLLRDRDVDRALDQVGSTVVDWHGGTRIGSALASFNLHWSRRVLSQGAVVLLVTDGLDRDGGRGIALQARRLRLSCRRLIWLNPLLRFAAFEPRAAGIRALLPEVSEHRPVHDLSSLDALVEALNQRTRRTG